MAKRYLLKSLKQSLLLLLICLPNMIAIPEDACTDDTCIPFGDDARPIPDDEALKYVKDSLHTHAEDDTAKGLKTAEEDRENMGNVHETAEVDKDNVGDAPVLKANVDEQSETSVSEPKLDTDKNVEGEAPTPGKVRNEYEFPPLTRIDPGVVGDRVDVELEDGRFYTRITRAVQPPIFQIPNFLSDEECDHIMETAKNNGLNVSNLFGSDIHTELESDIPLAEISRISEQTWLQKTHVGEEFWNRLHKRLARLTELDIGVIHRGEHIQVVSYVPGGHYHAHLDTTDRYDKPCCFQTHCGDKALTPQWAECCKLCRYMTVLYYLNDAEVGGETAFPLADASDSTVKEKFVNVEEQDWYNLSYYCYNSSLVVKPVRGTAIMWYNHFIDEQTGYLGKADQRSQHGGCDLIKGSKWIANNWISSPSYDDRFKPSVFYNEP